MNKFMKKTIALLLAGVLTLGMGLTAFAAEASDPASEPGSFTITKSYTSTDGTTFPSETLSFTVTADTANPDGGTALITVGTNNTFTVTGVTNEISVNYPAYAKVGIYRYTIKEVAGSSQGVTYDTTTEIDVAILVSYAEDGSLEVQAGVEKASPDADKEDTITNEYKLGGSDPDDPDDPDEPGTNSLFVTKDVTGNLGNKDKLFTIHVTLTAETGKTVNSDIAVSGGSDSGNTQTISKGWTGNKEITIQLKDGETVSFDKVPAGITYSVEEDSAHLIEGTTPTTAELNGEEGYTVSYEDETGTIAVGFKPVAAVTNNKETGINTGISMDSIPYILMLAAVAIAAVLFFRGRRVED